jgi:hypothetical protein
VKVAPQVAKVYDLALKLTWEEIMIRVIAAAAFAFALTTSAYAITPTRLHQPNGVITQVREACGVGMHWRNDLGRCVTTPARRQARRCLVWGAGHVCRKWG